MVCSARLARRGRGVASTFAWRGCNSSRTMWPKGSASVLRDAAATPTPTAAASSIRLTPIKELALVEIEGAWGFGDLEASGLKQCAYLIGPLRRSAAMPTLCAGLDHRLVTGALRRH